MSAGVRGLPNTVERAPRIGHQAGSLAALLGRLALGLLPLAVGMALYLHLALPQLGKPLVYDEAAFAAVGEAIATTGLPYANLGHLGYHGNIEQRFNWGLWHPPLYVYTLGLSYRLLGVAEWSARLVGIISNLGAALFVYLAAREALRGRTAPDRSLSEASVGGTGLATHYASRTTYRSSGWAAAAAFLYLTNPLVIQSALLLDIDGTVLVLLLSVLLFVYLRLVQAQAWRTWLGWCGLSTVVFALALWAKLTSPWALPAALLVYRLNARRSWQPWRGVLEILISAGGGSTLFFITWWLVARLAGMPFAMPFEVVWGEFLDAAGSTAAWRTQPRLLAELVAYVVLWISPYLVALFGWAVLRRIADLVDGRPRLLAEPIDLALLAGGGLALLYLLKLAASFPKYHIAMLPMWAVAAGWLLYRYVGKLGVTEAGAYLLALAGFGAYFTTNVQDRFVLFRDWSFIEPLVVIPAALGLAFVAAGPLLRRSHIPRQCILLLFLLLIAWSYGVGARQAVSPASTAYFYGTSGAANAAQVLDGLLEDGEPYVAAKEVAWYARDKAYLDQDSFDEVLSSFDRDWQLWDGTMLSMPVRVLALFIWDPKAGAWYRGHLGSLYEQVAIEGSYFVFVRREE